MSKGEKLQITLNSKVVKSLKDLCESYGLNKSQMIAMAVSSMAMKQTKLLKGEDNVQA